MNPVPFKLPAEGLEFYFGSRLAGGVGAASVLDQGKTYGFKSR